MEEEFPVTWSRTRGRGGSTRKLRGVHREQGRSSVRCDNELQGNEVSDEVTGFGEKVAFKGGSFRVWPTQLIPF